MMDIKIDMIKELKGISEEDVEVRWLKPVEAIGSADKEFVLAKGKEFLVEAHVLGGVGQAFTDVPSNTRGKVKDLLRGIFGGSRERAIAIATFNAVLNLMGILENPIHCKDEEPIECGKILAPKILDEFGKDAKIVHIGYQPGHVRATTETFEHVWITDLDEENIGKIKFGRKVLDGRTENEGAIRDADVALITGSTLVNGTVWNLLSWVKEYNTKAILYGVTIKGFCELFGDECFCPISREVMR
jgi:Domain of unknown function (DUF364).